MVITSLVSVLVQRLTPVSATLPTMTTLAGVSFAQQAPDLAKGVGLTAREMSGLAVPGSGVFK
jgi:hypothetical protein